MSIKRQKGNCIVDFYDDFVVFDLETTHFNYSHGDIIEIGAIKVEGNKIVDTFESFVKYEGKLSKRITKLTGITDEMLKDAPLIENVVDDFNEFIQDYPLVAHNAHFDINFMYDTIKNINGNNFNNDFIDTLRLSRLLYKDFTTHKLSYLSEELNLKNTPTHRSLSDCYATLDLYYKCKENCLKNNIDLSKEKIQIRSNYSNNKIQVPKLDPETIKFDKNHALYNKECVFTGKLKKYSRKDAKQAVKNLGGSCKSRITNNTNYLIMGVPDYSKFADGKESTKTKQAKKHISKGQDLKIIHEDDFIELLKTNKNEVVESIYAKIKRILIDNDKDTEKLNLKELMYYHTILFDKTALFRIHTGKPIYLEVKSMFKDLIPDIFNIKDLKSIPLWVKVELNKPSDVYSLIDLILETYDETIGYEEFGCCSKFMECSDAKECIHPDIAMSKGCLYKKNLEEGKIFYGKNANT